jgi:tetratricopeptide (TPR) repeat protein
MQLATIAWAQTDEATMEKELQTAGDSPDGAFMVLNFRGQLAGARGQLKAARDFTYKAKQAMEQLKLKQGPANALTELSVLELVAGERLEAVAHANEALKLSTATDVEGTAAQVLAYAGNQAKALTLADDISRRRPNDTLTQFILLPLIKSLVELERGNPAKAMDLLDTAEVYARASSGLHYVRGLTYLKSAKGNEAVQEFERIIATRGSGDGPDVLVSLAHLGLGRAYAMQNDQARARIAYQDFLAIWKNADPDVPVLKQAKAEYDRMKQS